MAWRFDSWESSFYPKTYDPLTGQGVLRNLREFRSAEALARFEYRMSAAWQRQLEASLELIRQSLDAAQVRAIHRHLFQDVYEWAGEFRTVDMAKGRHGFFATVEGRPSGIEAALSRVSEAAHPTGWPRADRAQFAQGMAQVFSWANHAHGFREGNGRAGKVFLSQIGQRSRFDLDFGGVDPRAWNLLSDASRPREGQAMARPEMMAELFEDIAVERPTRPAAPPLGASPLWRASYPQAPIQATRRGTDTPETGPRRGSPYGPGRDYGRGQGR